MNNVIGTVAADGRIILEQTDPPRVLKGDETPPRSSIGYVLMHGAEWEGGAGLLRGTVGEKLADKTRPLTLSIERVSVVRSSREKGDGLDLHAGDLVELVYVTDPQHIGRTVTETLQSLQLISTVGAAE
jgi:hypothetical protein